MTWTLVLILFIEGELKASVVDDYDDFFKCFAAREKLSVLVGSTQPGYFPPSSQAVCIWRGGESV